MSKFKSFFAKNGSKRKIGVFLGRFFAVIAVLALAGAVFAGMVFIYYTRDLPRPEKFSEKNNIQSTKIYDRTGAILLYEIYGEEKRNWVNLASIPDSMEKMAVAAEDKNFYKNNIGIDIEGITRSFLTYFKTGRVMF